MSKLTCATVNKELKKLGYSERLVKGDGHMYFIEGNASNGVGLGEKGLDSMLIYTPNGDDKQEKIGRNPPDNGTYVSFITQGIMPAMFGGSPLGHNGSFPLQQQSFNG